MKKLAALFVITVCILIMVLGCGKQTTSIATTSTLNPSPLNTSALIGKTYANSQYGFSVQYPADWTSQEGVSGTIVMFAGPTIASTGGVININIVSEKLSDSSKVSLSDYVKAGEAQLKKNFPDFTKTSDYNTTIGGQPAEVFVFTGSVNKISLKFAQTYLLKNNQSYVITYASGPDMFDKYSNAFNLAITSFKLN
jgi:hypothetical protein